MQPVIALFQDKVSEIINAPGSSFAEHVEQPVTEPVKQRTTTKLHYRNEPKQQTLPKPRGLEPELSEGELSEPEQEQGSHSPELAGSVEHDSDEEHALRIASPDEEMDQEPGQQETTGDTESGEITQEVTSEDQYHDASDGIQLTDVERQHELMIRQQPTQNLSTQQLLQDIRNYRGGTEVSLSNEVIGYMTPLIMNFNRESERIFRNSRVNMNH